MGSISRFSPPGSLAGRYFLPIPNVGDVFTGSFTLDDAILASDGVKSGVPVSGFTLEIAGVGWTQGDASSVFHGFRDVSPASPLRPHSS